MSSGGFSKSKSLLSAVGGMDGGGGASAAAGTGTAGREEGGRVARSKFEPRLQCGS